MPVLHQPCDDLIQSALVADVELLGLVGADLLCIAADGGAGAAGYLADAQPEQLGAHLLALAGGDDDAGVRHGEADAGGDLLKYLVRDAAVELVGIDIVGALYTRHADSVRAHAVDGLKVLCVHDEPCELVLVQLQTEQYAQTYVVDAALHSAVHRLGVIVIVVLGAGGMELEVALLVIGLLE